LLREGLVKFGSSSSNIFIVGEIYVNRNIFIGACE